LARLVRMVDESIDDLINVLVPTFRSYQSDLTIGDERPNIVDGRRSTMSVLNVGDG
jgi:hypothetical protein